MAGSRSLQVYLAILEALADGPQPKNELKRACGYDVCREYPALDRLLANMRVAGLIECSGKAWRLAGGKELCSQCHGRGLWDKEETA